MFKDVVIVCVFLRNRVFIIRQKCPLANFRVELLSCLAREDSWWISPSINSAFSSLDISRHGQFLHIAFVRDVTETVGRWLIVNHKHDDYASRALTFVNVTNTNRLYGGEIERERERERLE